MLKSTTSLPDINVWLALASSRPAPATFCPSWIKTIETERIAFPQVSRMGLHRLLMSESIMGNEVVTSRRAWRIYESLSADERVQFACDSFTLEQHSRSSASLDRSVLKAWTHADLAAFTRTGAVRLVTLDRAVLALEDSALLFR